MAKNFRQGVLIVGDASGAIKQIKLTDEELKKLNSRTKESKSRAKELAAQWGSAAKTAAKWGAGIAAAAAAAGAALVKNAATSARELDTLTRVSNANAEQFQRWTAGAKTVGIEQQKLADILKDTNDRVGDFLSTGGGPMADFFEQIAPRVGVTAEQFRNLSGPDALQLYVSSLQKANLSQSEMTFYMEAMASDASTLLPLLRDNGAAMGELGDTAQRVGAVVDNETQAALLGLNEQFEVMDLVTQGAKNTLVKELLPAITSVSSVMVDYSTNTDLVAGAASALDVVLKSLVTTGIVIAATFEAAGKRLGALAAALMSAAKGEFSQAWSIIQESNTDTLAIIDQTAARIKKLWAEDSVNWSKIMVDTTKRVSKAFGETGQQITESLEAQNKALAAAGKELDKYFEQEEKRSLNASKLLETNRENIDLLRRELAATREGGRALQDFNRTKAIELAMRQENVSKLLPTEREAYRALVAQQYDLQAEVESLTSKANPMAIAYERGIERIRDGFGDFFQQLIVDGKASFDDLLDLFKSTIAEMIATAAANRVMISLGMSGNSGISLGGGLGGMGGGGSSGAGGLSNLLSLKNIANGINGAVAGIGRFVNMMPQSVSGGFVQTGANIATNAAFEQAVLEGGLQQGYNLNAGYGALATAAAGYAGGYLGQEVFEGMGGKYAESNYGQTAGALGGAYVGAAYGSWGGPIGAAIGAFVGALVDVLGGGDGKKRFALGVAAGDEVAGTGEELITESGLRLTTYTKRVGEEGQELADAMQRQFAAIDSAMLDFADNLFGVTGIDLSGDSLVGKAHQSGKEGGTFFGSNIFNGVSDDDIRGASREFILAWTDAVNEEMGTALDFTPLLDLAAEGEDAGDALIRLNSQFAAVNNIIGSINGTLFESSVAGVAAADGLVQAMGGLDRFAASADFFYQNFYDEQDRASALVEQYSSIIGEFNREFGTAIESKTDLRDFVESLDLTSEAGQQAYAASMNLAGAVVGLDDAMRIATQGADIAAASMEDVASSIAGMFADTYQRIMLDGMKTDKERYDYWSQQANAIADAMNHISDPEAMRAAMEQYNQIVGQAYGSLSSESQDKMREDLLGTIEAVRNEALDVIGADPLPPMAEQQNLLSDLMGTLAEITRRQEQGERQRQESDSELRANFRELAAALGSTVDEFGNFVLRLPGNITVNVPSPEVY